LSRADALVINGGYSAVSEAFVLGKPVFVVPVSGHAEQFVNAALVRDLGLGFVADETNVLDQLLTMYQQNRWIGRKTLPAAFEMDGAREACGAIGSFLRKHKMSPLSFAEPLAATRLHQPEQESL
jgi:UDP-N-acetylglucosamine:LPS N-acetylglucosamine transferase